jgi:hypothetical protein
VLWGRNTIHPVVVKIADKVLERAQMLKNMLLVSRLTRSNKPTFDSEGINDAHYFS